MNPIAYTEYLTLTQEAEDVCARLVASATSTNVADGALFNMHLRIKRIDRMSEEQLLSSAAHRAQRQAGAQAEQDDAAGDMDATAAVERPRPRAGG